MVAIPLTEAKQDIFGFLLFYFSNDFDTYIMLHFDAVNTMSNSKWDGYGNNHMFSPFSVKTRTVHGLWVYNMNATSTVCTFQLPPIGNLRHPMTFWRHSWPRIPSGTIGLVLGTGSMPWFESVFSTYTGMDTNISCRPT